MEEDGQPKSLEAVFTEAEQRRQAVESSLEPATSPTRQADLAAAVTGYRKALQMIDKLSIFSPNETADDLSTSHLPFLLVDFRLAGLFQKVVTSTPRERRVVLGESRAAYERFLHRLDSYELLSDPQARLLREYDEGPSVFSTLPTDPARRRDAKIASFRAEKELAAKLEALKRRAASSRLEGGGDVDDEVAREVRLTQLEMCANEALQALEGINREEEVLAMAPPPEPDTAAARLAAISLDEGERRRAALRDEAVAAARLDNPLKGLQSRSGPLLDKSGRPLQPFTIVGNRADLTKGVFRPGHNLPTMSIDEYLEEERRRGGIIEGGGEASGRVPEPDEDNIEKADAETMKAREWDEFKEENPRGSGNTLNRG